MPSDIKSAMPFGVPVIGSAELVSAINVVTLKCTCKSILMGQMGIVIPCTRCNKAWYVSAESKIKIQEVLADINNKLTANG